MLKKIFAALLIVTALILPQSVSAQEDWFAANYDFRNIKSVIVLDATINPYIDYGGMIGLRGLQNNFWSSCSEQLRPTCTVYSEEQAQQIIGDAIGVNFERLSLDDPVKARQLVIDNAWRVADAYILGIVETWGGSNYVAPSDVDFKQVISHRVYYNTDGTVEQVDNPKIPAEVRYRAQSSDVAAIGMIMRLCLAKDRAIVFERFDMRQRPADVSQMDLFDNMSAAFANDVAAKIRG